jgi:hypothetical protein
MYVPPGNRVLKAYVEFPERDWRLQRLLALLGRFGLSGGLERRKLVALVIGHDFR